MILKSLSISFFFFFQAEDGIRDTSVTGVQTCALPISGAASISGFIQVVSWRVQAVGETSGQSGLATARPADDMDAARRFPIPHLVHPLDRKSTRLNSSHRCISYAVFCLKKKKINNVLR